MKKLLIITNLFWVCVIVLPSFVQSENTNPANTSPYHLVDASLAKMMADNYRKNYIDMRRRVGKYPNFTYPANVNDARSIWFSLEMLKTFISDIETQGTAAGKMPSGLRFYYIQYPAQILPTNNTYAYFDGVDPKFANLHSLMSVPTYFDATANINVDYDPRKGIQPISEVFDNLIAGEKTNKENVNRSKSPSLNSFKANVLLSNNLDDNPTDPANVANQGQMIPPPYNTSSVSKINVPCSGANLMIYFDWNGTCGQKSVSIDKTGSIGSQMPKN